MSTIFGVILVFVVVAVFVFQVIGLVGDIKDKKRVKNKNSGKSPENTNKGDIIK